MKGSSMLNLEIGMSRFSYLFAFFNLISKIVLMMSLWFQYIKIGNFDQNKELPLIKGGKNNNSVISIGNAYQT